MENFFYPSKDAFYLLLINSAILTLKVNGFNPLLSYYFEAQKILPHLQAKGFTCGLKVEANRLVKIDWPKHNCKLFNDPNVGSKAMWGKISSMVSSETQKQYYNLLLNSNNRLNSYLSFIQVENDGMEEFTSPLTMYLSREFTFNETHRSILEMDEIELFDETFVEFVKLNNLPRVPVRQQFLILLNEINKTKSLSEVKNPLTHYLQDALLLIDKCISKDHIKKILYGSAIKVNYSEVNCKYFNQPDTGSRMMWAKLKLNSPHESFTNITEEFDRAYLNLNCPDSLRLCLVEMYNGIYNYQRIINKVDKVPPMGKFASWRDCKDLRFKKINLRNENDELYIRWLVDEWILNRNMQYLAYPPEDQDAWSYLINCFKKSKGL